LERFERLTANSIPSPIMAHTIQRWAGQKAVMLLGAS
jgi:hypothetical protein